MDHATADRPAAHPPGEGGFSLVETVFAVLVLVVAAGGLVRALAHASEARRAAADTDLATRIAEARMQELMAAPFWRGWPWPGHHAAATPGGTVEIDGAGAPGYFAYFGEEGEPADRRSARYEVRWRIGELAARGGNRLAALRLEVVAMPVAGGRGSVVRLDSVRVANRE